MASIINAGTTSNTALNMSADTSGTLDLQSNGTTMASVTSTGFNIGGAVASGFTMKNRIINGDMVISQRNGTSSVTPVDGQYTLDRWKSGLTQASKFSVQQNAGSVTPPAGFSNYLGVTSSSAYSVISTDEFEVFQLIEGFNTADLAWGTANARTVTLSFWVRSSLTGTFGGCLFNGAINRSYVFSYTISSANTWQQVSVTIAGDTSGTWVSATNGTGIAVLFNFGAGSSRTTTAGAWNNAFFVAPTGATSVVGTNGATFYITGVQLERGSQATSFEWLPYSTELALCQRYCFVGTNANCFVGGAAASSTNMYIKYVLPMPMRATPTLSFVSSIVMSDQYVADFTATTPTVATAPNIADHSGRVQLGGFSGLTTGRWYGGASNAGAAQSIFSAEL